MPADSSPSYIYRRTYDRGLWHFCSNCPEWPTQEFVEESGMPATGLYCPKCLASEQAGECQVAYAQASKP